MSYVKNKHRQRDEHQHEGDVANARWVLGRRQDSDTHEEMAGDGAGAGIVALAADAKLRPILDVRRDADADAAGDLDAAAAPAAAAPLADAVRTRLNLQEVRRVQIAERLPPPVSET